jgi:hypothetical protein
MAESEWQMRLELFPYFGRQDVIILPRTVKLHLQHPNIYKNKMQLTPGSQLKGIRRVTKIIPIIMRRLYFAKFASL